MLYCKWRGSRLQLPTKYSGNLTVTSLFFPPNGPAHSCSTRLNIVYLDTLCDCYSRQALVGTSSSSRINILDVVEAHTYHSWKEHVHCSTNN